MTDLTMASGLLNHQQQQQSPIIGSQAQIPNSATSTTLSASSVEVRAVSQTNGLANQIQLSNFESALRLAAEFLAHHHQTQQQQFADNHPNAPTSRNPPQLNQTSRLTFPNYQQSSRQSLLDNQTSLFANQQQPLHQQVQTSGIQTSINQQLHQHRMALLSSQNNRQQNNVASAIHAQLLLQNQVCLCFALNYHI